MKSPHHESGTTRENDRIASFLRWERTSTSTLARFTYGEAYLAIRNSATILLHTPSTEAEDYRDLSNPHPPGS
ncbi:hypothetical protein AFLA_000954 [Aspergillus flavus NRRL3357]|nr:hypothetical protein AFLA_000954 [Aspergillus flavus NRRL3357]